MKMTLKDAAIALGYSEKEAMIIRGVLHNIITPEVAVQKLHISKRELERVLHAISNQQKLMNDDRKVGKKSSKSNEK